VRIAKGEILIFVDSDSVVDEDAPHYIVQSFVNPKVGAVCGHAYVLNNNVNILTKMQDVRYYLAFRVNKAAEHLFKTVTCCSGCLSAYRKEYLLEFFDKWLNQSFLGMPATFGDDRSLTNFFLKKYWVLYDSRAMAKTVVPSNWRVFFNQQLRWKKSWFRESLIACKFMWSKHIIASLSFYAAFVIPLISPLVVINAFIYRPIFLAQVPFFYVFGFGMISLLYGLYYLVKRPNRKWIYGLYFCFLYMAFLSWQTYYAIFTTRRNKWGTR